jgi:adenosylcobinamide-GDP ribazoletransferase
MNAGPPSPLPKPQPGWLDRWDEIRAAAIFLTRLPIKFDKGWPQDLNRRATAWFPLIGALVGLVGGLVFWLGISLELPILAAAFLAVTAQVLMTGAFHEDGLADTADGFGGGTDRETKLTIMRDSRVGTFGALALVLAVGLRVSALASLTALGGFGALGVMIAVGAVSRAPAVAIAHWLPPARSDGLSADHGLPPPWAVITSAVTAAFGIVVVLISAGWLAAVAVLVVVPVIGAGIAYLSYRQIGGQTGDVLGASQQVCEIAALLAVSASR